MCMSRGGRREKVLVLLDKAVHFLAVVVVKCEGCIDVTQRELGIGRDDLIGRFSLLSPEDDVLDAYSRSGNPRMATTRSWRDIYMVGRFHVGIIL
jgi:hypothetical protein